MSVNNKRFGEVGFWELNLETNRISWSSNIYGMFGVAPDRFGHTFDAFLGLVHPEDRAELQAQQAEAIRSGSRFDFTHRVVLADGRQCLFREVAEKICEFHGNLFHGVVQNVTASIPSFVGAAGDADLGGGDRQTSQLGGWRYAVGDDHVCWTEATARIHGLPTGTQPSLDQAIAMYVPEHRAKIRDLFDACLTTGASYDEVLQIVSATGRRIWIRTVGDAERDTAGRTVAVFGAFQDISEFINKQAQADSIPQQLRDAFEAIDEGLLLVDSSMRLCLVNDAAYEILNLSKGALGSRLVEMWPELTGHHFVGRLKMSLDDMRSASFLCHLEHIEKWIDVRTYPSIDGMAVRIVDVTKERAQTSKLRLLEGAVANLRDMILITEASPLDAPSGPKIVYANDAFYRETGFSSNEIIGATPRVLQGADTQRDRLDAIKLALVAQRPFHTQLINYRKSGEAFWVEMDIVPISEGGGEVHHFVAVQRDVTERKHTEDAMRTSEERFRLASRSLTDAIWDWDIVNDRIWRNDRLLASFDYTPEDQQQGIAGWKQRILGEDRDRVFGSLQEALQGNDTSWNAEYRLSRYDGSLVTVAHRAHIVRDERGAPVRMVGNKVDISARLQVEERVRQSEKLEAVGQLTGGVAHDFNNLLTVILGNAELVLAGLPEQDKLRPLVEMIAVAADRGSELTGRLLAFSRRQPLQPKVVDPVGLLKGMEALLKRTLPEDVDLNIRAGKMRCSTLVDPGQLEIAILNLSLNAKDAMRSGGKLTIQADRVELDGDSVGYEEALKPGTFVRISVSDTGSGMTSDVRERAFDPFFTTKPVGQGSGLGLSMVYGFVKQSGGQVTIYSELGQGTSVKIYLPCVEAEVGLQESASVQDIVGGCEHILLVEDDELVRHHVSRTLTSLGYTVTTAFNGPDALQKLQKGAESFDLLFTDVIMPGGMNGRELVSSALLLRPQLKVLFTSGYTSDDVAMLNLAAECQLLSKPYRRGELAEAIRRALSGKS